MITVRTSGSRAGQAVVRISDRESIYLPMIMLPSLVDSMRGLILFGTALPVRWQEDDRWTHLNLMRLGAEVVIWCGAVEITIGLDEAEALI